MKLILKMIILVSLCYLTIFIFLLLKRKAEFYSGKVVKTNKLKVASLQVLLYQVEMILLLAKFIFNKAQIYFEEKNTQNRKMIVLQNVVYHLNQNLNRELEIKTVSPSTSNGVGVWIYLVNNLNDDEKFSLENYFIGVISKYTSEFALDVLTVKQVIGAGWVAIFDVKTIEEATYNRMARQTEINQEEDF
jgi:hypothetical protein